MTPYKVMNLFLRLGVKILKLVHRGKLDNVQSIGQNTIWLAFEQVLALVSRDVRNCGEDITRMGRCTFDTVTVVNSSLARFSIHIEILKVVVEINGSSAQVSSKKGSVSCEDGCNIDSSLAAERESHAGKPLMKMCNNCTGLLVADELRKD